MTTNFGWAINVLCNPRIPQPTNSPALSKKCFIPSSFSSKCYTTSTTSTLIPLVSISPRKRNNHRTETLYVSSILFLTHPPLFPYTLFLLLLIRMDGSICSLDSIYFSFFRDIISEIIPSFTVLILSLCTLLISSYTVFVQCNYSH